MQIIEMSDGTRWIVPTSLELGAIQKVVDQFYWDEEKSYEEDPVPNHIFHELKILENMLMQIEREDKIKGEI